MSGLLNIKPTSNKVLNVAMSADINIDNGSGTTLDEVILVTDRALTIEKAYIYYTEATDTTGAASANAKIGTAVGGAQIVAATALEVSQAVGDTTSMTLVNPSVAAGGMIAVRHTGIAATEAGKYRVVVLYSFND